MTYLFIRQYGLFHNLCDVSSCRFCTKFWFAIILLQVTNILTLNILMKALKFLSDISPFCKGHWYSYFGLLVISALDFKFMMISLLVFFVTYTQWISEIHSWGNTCQHVHSHHGSPVHFSHLLV